MFHLFISLYLFPSGNYLRVAAMKITFCYVLLMYRKLFIQQLLQLKAVVAHYFIDAFDINIFYITITILLHLNN